MDISRDKKLVYYIHILGIWLMGIIAVVILLTPIGAEPLQGQGGFAGMIYLALWKLFPDGYTPRIVAFSIWSVCAYFCYRESKKFK